MIPNREGWHYLVMKNCIIKRDKVKTALLRRIKSMMMTFIVSPGFIGLEQKINLNCIKMYVKIKIL